jgi:flagellar hook-basal body complex protein FliE
MTVSSAQAAMAYANAARQAMGAGQGEATARMSGEGSASFGDVLRDVVQDTVKAGRVSEQKAIAAINNEGDVLDVVTAVSAAEVTLETVIAVRDRVVSAYQEIMRMPI